MADRDRVAIEQPARRRERCGRREAKHAALPGQTVDQKLVCRVRADDGQLETFGQFGRAAGMIDVGMGQPDLPQRQTLAPDFREHGIEIAAGIDDSRLARLAAPDDGAVLLEGGHGEGTVAQHVTRILG